MNLGTLIKELSQQKQDNEVVYNFGYFFPTNVRSYRGYYEHLALNYRNDGEDRINVITLKVILQEAIGKSFEGYKGGMYRMNAETKVYVSNWGESSNTTILSLEDHGYQTVIMTGYDED